MAFSIDASALHRPLGFELGKTAAGAITVERHDPEREGAAAAALLPPDSIAAPEERTLRAQLTKSRGALRSIDAPAAALAAGTPSVVASSRGIVDGHRVSVLGLAAGRIGPPDRGALRVVLLTDARLAPEGLERLLGEVAARSFAGVAGLAAPKSGDRIVALASGVAGEDALAQDSIGYTTLLVESVALAHSLTRQLLERAFAPECARVVQITLSGAPDDGSAAAIVEALAADPAIRAAMEREGPDSADCAAIVQRAAPALARDATKLRSAWSARAAQAALRIDLGAGGAIATRWTSVKADAAR